ncbi:hypothetical protein EJ06DRAFT_299497 [Trichodelitschia bisporula]|uniref:Uncharacterized protein n=1 Tax=Trichodelitschia bisporula TaxID=703511 RepID=A0A6G1I6N3_9PEZI|nr:hypothetical protein EJ06DRAFT_299497 [Trichodelitschia bisporula]
MARDFSITRRQAGPGEALDPTASLEFWPAKGSDELFEALKKAYPHLPNQAARMRQAVIDFLLDEQREENWLQEQAQSVTNPPSQSQYLPSPELTFVSSTGSIPSPTTSSHTPQPASESSKSSASTPQSSKLPALKDCMHEWSLPSKNQPKLHHRRAMTSKEKEAYKMKRISGACADCKRKRRKCSHDTSGSQQTSPSSSGKYRVSKKTVAAVPGIVSKAPVAAQLSTPVSTVAVSSDSSQNSESANHSIDPTASSNLSFDALQDIPWNDFVLFDPPQPEVELDMSSHWFGNNSWSNNVPGDFVDLPAFPTSTNHIPSLETSLDFSSASSQPTPDFSLAHDAASFSQAVNHNPFVSTHQLPDLSYTSAPTHTLVGPTMDFAMPASQGAPLDHLRPLALMHRMEWHRLRRLLAPRILFGFTRTIRTVRVGLLTRVRIGSLQVVKHWNSPQHSWI